MYNSNRTGRNMDNRTRSTLILSQPEPIIGDNTWRSPGVYVVELDPKLTENIDYTSGSAVYTGLDTIQIEIVSTVSTKATNANTTVLMTTGIEGVEDTTQEIKHTLTSGNEDKELTHQGVHEWKTGETLDFFIKADSNITIEKAVWKIKRYDV